MARKNWHNLVEKKCPCCDYKLERHVLTHTTFRHVESARWECPGCSFTIGENRMKEVVSDLHAQVYAEGAASFIGEDDNFERLQSL